MSMVTSDDTSDDEPHGSKPAKKLKRDLAACILCGEKGDIGKLTKPKDSSSWHTLLDAAEVRHFEPILQYSHMNEEIPDIHYDSVCRNRFTNNKALEDIRRRSRASDEPQSKDEPSRQKRQSISACKVSPSKCIFCDAVSKYAKGTRTREKLIKCVELRADERVRSVASRNVGIDRSTEEIEVDQRVLLAVNSRDMVAAESHYHFSCYINYTRSKPPKVGNPEAVKDDDEQLAYKVAETKAYDKLFDYIRTTIIESPCVTPLTDLTKKLETFLLSQGVNEMKPSTKTHVRRTLESEFGSCLCFISHYNGKVLVMPETLSRETLAKENVVMREKLRMLYDISDNDAQLLKTAAYLRSEVKSVHTHQPWPPYPNELTEDYVNIPPSLELFLTRLLTGESRTPASTPRNQRVVFSLAQDVLYHVSSGKIITPKHVLLPWAIKSMTGNVASVRILNRLGHGVSYTKLEEIETALCLEKMASEEERDTLIPSCIFSNVPTHLAFDNIDRLEETLSGAGTSHRVNGIIVQETVYGPPLPPARREVTEDKRRSLQPDTLILPPYHSPQKKSPPSTTPLEPSDLEETAATIARQKNLLWSLMRQWQSSSSDQKISAWTGFNIRLHENNLKSISKDTIGYLPTINAPATQMSTVHKILVQAKSIKDVLQLPEIVCVFDQALYAKAAEIVWTDQLMFSTIVLRMGTFHTMCNLLSIIGKRFGDAGLRDLAVETGLIAEGSITKVLDGRHYNRGVRLHKIVYESLLRILWQSYFNEIESRTNLRESLDETLMELGDACNELNFESLQRLMDHTPTMRILNSFQQYCDEMRTQNGPMASYWMTYIDMVEILLAMIRASREGNWPLHIHAIRSMIPWCFAYDKVNYARYLSIYHAQMTRLEEEHPSSYQHMMNGGFSVQITSSNPFGRVPVDQTLEETINKDTQTPGGTKGFSLKPSTVTKYYLATEYRSKVLRQIRQLSHLTKNGTSNSHPDFGTSRTLKDESDVQSVVDLLQSSSVHPFSGRDSELSSLSTGMAVHPEVKKDLLKARDLGEAAANRFAENRLGRGSAFFDPLPKLKLKTFGAQQIKTKTGTGNKETMLKADHQLFGRMLLIAGSRQLDMKEVLQHPLGPIPWALANSDGSLKKTDKSALAKNLEKGVLPEKQVAQPCAAIIDGMALVQKLEGNNWTFAEISEKLLKTALHSYPASQRIDVVFDVYRDSSIKEAERGNRGADQGISFSQIVPTHRVKNWRRVLSCPASKRQLTHFFMEDWQRRQNMIADQKELFVTYDCKCIKITKDTVMEIPQLASTHEEADTRVILHASHAARSGFKSIVIVAEDTDILVLCIAYKAKIDCDLYMLFSTRNRSRLLSITKIVAVLGNNLCESLLGLHAYTGCDTVSAFSGIGKVKGLKLIREDDDFRDAFARLGSQWNLSSDVLKLLQAFTCRLYASRSPDTDVNSLRFNLWRAKKSIVESGQLPPCEDTLNQHALRANYQSAIWKRCLEPKPIVPAPEDNHGWGLTEDGKLRIKWMTGPPAPEVILQFISCKCRRVCELPSCQCMANGLKCTDECSLKECGNMNEADPTEDTFEDQSDDDYSYEDDAML